MSRIYSTPILITDNVDLKLFWMSFDLVTGAVNRVYTLLSADFYDISYDQLIQVSITLEKLFNNQAFI